MREKENIEEPRRRGAELDRKGAHADGAYVNYAFVSSEGPCRATGRDGRGRDPLAP